jgi:hypothetical protein
VARGLWGPAASGETAGGIAHHSPLRRWSLDRAPADPLFWMHHANIDRLWWQWHNSAQGQGQIPNLQGADAIMDPWAFTETDTRDIAAFHYTYA